MYGIGLVSCVWWIWHRYIYEEKDGGREGGRGGVGRSWSFGRLIVVVVVVVVAFGKGVGGGGYPPLESKTDRN